MTELEQLREENNTLRAELEQQKALANKAWEWRAAYFKMRERFHRIAEILADKQTMWERRLPEE